MPLFFFLFCRIVVCWCYLHRLTKPCHFKEMYVYYWFATNTINPELTTNL
jgi:hypothetical protein